MLDSANENKKKCKNVKRGKKKKKQEIFVACFVETQNIGGIASKRLIWYMETILSSSCAVCISLSLSRYLFAVPLHCSMISCTSFFLKIRHNAARSLHWLALCVPIQSEAFHVSIFSAFLHFSKFARSVSRSRSFSSSMFLWNVVFAMAKEANKMAYSFVSFLSLSRCFLICFQRANIMEKRFGILHEFTSVCKSCVCLFFGAFWNYSLQIHTTCDLELTNEWACARWKNRIPAQQQALLHYQRIIFRENFILWNVVVVDDAVAK